MAEKVQGILVNSTTRAQYVIVRKSISRVQDYVPSKMELGHRKVLEAMLQTVILSADEQLKAYYYYCRRGLLMACKILQIWSENSYATLHVYVYNS